MFISYSKVVHIRDLKFILKGDWKDEFHMQQQYAIQIDLPFRMG